MDTKGGKQGGGGDGGGGMNWEIRIDVYTLLYISYIKQITNKKLLYKKIIKFNLIKKKIKCSFSLSRFVFLSGHEFNGLTSFMNLALIITPQSYISVLLPSLSTFVYKLWIFYFHCRSCGCNFYSTKYLSISWTFGSQRGQ